MQKNLNNERLNEELNKELRIKEYLVKYIKELQRHFDVSDKKMRKILYKVYQDLSPLNLIKSWIYMVKSKCKKEINLKGNIDGN